MTWPFNPSTASGRRSRPEPVGERLARFVRRAFLAGALLILASALGYCGWSMYRFIYKSGNFQIQTIEIHGASEELKQEARTWLNKRFAKSGGNNLCVQDKRILAIQLGLLPRAKSAVVSKIYPDTLRVDFVERLPIIIALLDEPFLMDEDGVLLARITPESMRKTQLPVLTGIHDAACRPGDKIKKDRLSDVLNAVSYIRVHEDRLSKMIDEWHISGQSEVVAILNTKTEVRFGTTPPIELLDKLVTGLDMVKDLENATYIDLRYLDLNRNNERKLVYK